jgi:outer membrane protein OmpA-like peptidoglycan-associated protein
MRHFLLASASLAILAISSPVFAGSAEDAAYDKNKSTVVDSRGNCVRTKWMEGTDPCAVGEPAPAPKPAAAVPARPVAAVPAPIAQLSPAERAKRTVYFDFNKATLTAESKAKLDELSKVINNSSAITDVTIYGYTDQLGSVSYNDALANKRVAAVKEYLDSKSRLKAEGDIKGLGKASPEEGCDSIKNRAKKIACMANERRVEIEFNAQK